MSGWSAIFCCWGCVVAGDGYNVSVAVSVPVLSKNEFRVPVLYSTMWWIQSNISRIYFKIQLNVNRIDQIIICYGSNIFEITVYDFYPRNHSIR